MLLLAGLESQMNDQNPQTTPTFKFLGLTKMPFLGGHEK